MFTAAPAFASFTENERGTIEVGKRANVTRVLRRSHDRPSQAPIPTATAMLTVSDGRVTHEAL